MGRVILSVVLDFITDCIIYGFFFLFFLRATERIPPLDLATSMAITWLFVITLLYKFFMGLKDA